MKFSASVIALATAVSAASNVTYTTEVVTALTTFCPEATVLTHAGKTYTITEATTLTITDCPCTLTKPLTTSTTVSCTTTPAAPAWTVSAAPSPYSNGTTVAKGSATGSYVPTSTPSTVTAGAGKAAALSGAGLAMALGVAALL
ncbi:hypothetical protein CMQ_1607 [Grosmannia clavigera kw1407]|uniref:Clock-controlled protein 6 n=6 Tax=Ophiostomataceae TaxID=5152 RepID=F0XFA9_GROCL|nr:uncharacterized protein CMQ_1607 [Grosmannia clavigera kw1407]EFX04679.1 hypothetical protein CMQ_1607 [Grosmannia clavigera kw1407]